MTRAFALGNAAKSGRKPAVKIHNTKGETKMTKQNATQIIKDHKDMTAYFDGSMTAEQMIDMLMHRMHFGQAESLVITAALVKAGANLK